MSSKKNQHGGEIHLLYEALFHNTLDGIFIYNYESDEILDCNRAAVDLMGYSKQEEVLKLKRLDFVPQFDPMFAGIDLHKYTEENGRRVKKGEAFSTIGIFKGYQGKRILVKANVVPTFYSPKEAFIIFKDVTTEVLNKKALKKSEGRIKIFTIILMRELFT